MATDAKCACADCVCIVSPDQAVAKDGALYRCEACASGDAHHEGCDHHGCACRG